MSNPTPKALQRPIQDYDLSPEFKEMARTNGFRTLSQMVGLSIQDLLQKPLFDLRMLSEYITFLTKNGLDDLVED